MADANSPWEQIQQGVNETERLIGQKQYNMAMIKSRQTLEVMVKCLAEKALILDGSDLQEMIDQLYETKWISKTTMEHYHRIRILGNKAVHEGYANAADANQAYHILSQEVYAFSNDYNPRRRRTASTSSNRTSGRSSARSTSSRSRTGSSTARRRKKKSPAEDILRILVPIICVVLLILIIRALLPSGDTKETQPQTTAPSESVTMESTPANADALAPDDTTQENTQPQAAVYRTTATLNVRTEPSTSASILVQLPPDTEVNVTGTYDSQWTIINYDGQDAYVATAYLTQ